MEYAIRDEIANVTPRTNVRIPGLDGNDVLTATATLYGQAFN